MCCVRSTVWRSATSQWPVWWCRSPSSTTSFGTGPGERSPVTSGYLVMWCVAPLVFSISVVSPLTGMWPPLPSSLTSLTVPDNYICGTQFITRWLADLSFCGTVWSLLLSFDYYNYLILINTTLDIHFCNEWVASNERPNQWAVLTLVDLCWYGITSVLWWQAMTTRITLTPGTQCSHRFVYWALAMKQKMRSVLDWLEI